MIAKEKKPHNIGETLIKPCMLKAAAWSCFEKTYCKKITKIFLLDSTIKLPIDELAKDIECQVLKKCVAIVYLRKNCWCLQ